MTDIDARARELADTPERRRLESFIRSYKHVERYYEAMDGAINKHSKPEEWQAKYEALGRYISRHVFHYWQCLDRLGEIEYEAMGGALREMWQSDEYKAEIKAEARRENAREALLPKIRDYQNGHVTYFDSAGEVIGERL